MTAFTAANERLLARDARNRAARTLYQIVVVSVVVDVVPQVISALDGAAEFSWADLGKAALRSALAAGLAYVMRKSLDGTRIPTPLPPGPVAQPAEVPAPVAGPAVAGDPTHAAEHHPTADPEE